METTDNSRSDWRSGDLEGRTWCTYRWFDNHVEYVRNTSGKIRRYRSRAAAQKAAEALNRAA
jgi:hypothetical protein